MQKRRSSDEIDAARMISEFTLAAFDDDGFPIINDAKMDSSPFEQENAGSSVDDSASIADQNAHLKSKRSQSFLQLLSKRGSSYGRKYYASEGEDESIDSHIGLLKSKPKYIESSNSDASDPSQTFDPKKILSVAVEEFSSPQTNKNGNAHILHSGRLMRRQERSMKQWKRQISHSMKRMLKSEDSKILLETNQSAHAPYKDVTNVTFERAADDDRGRDPESDITLCSTQSFQHIVSFDVEDEIETTLRSDCEGRDDVVTTGTALDAGGDKSDQESKMKGKIEGYEKDVMYSESLLEYHDSSTQTHGPDALGTNQVRGDQQSAPLISPRSAMDFPSDSHGGNQKSTFRSIEKAKKSKTSSVQELQDALRHENDPDGHPYDECDAVIGLWEPIRSKGPFSTLYVKRKQDGMVDKNATSNDIDTVSTETRGNLSRETSRDKGRFAGAPPLKEILCGGCAHVQD